MFIVLIWKTCLVTVDLAAATIDNTAIWGLACTIAVTTLKIRPKDYKNNELSNVPIIAIQENFTLIKSRFKNSLTSINMRLVRIKIGPYGPELFWHKISYECLT